MAREQVKITSGDMEAIVSPKAAKVWERHGWTVVDDGSSEPEAAEPEAATTPEETTTSREAE